MNITERIATLLAQGIPAASVSTIVGLSPSRISQIQKEEGFSLLFQAKQAEFVEKDSEEIALAGRYLEAEHLLLKQVIEMAPASELRDVTAALKVVAERQEKAKSRISPVHQGSLTVNNIVQLQLPAHATPELHLSAQKEVIAIENRNLAPLPSAGVLSLFKSLGQNTEETAQPSTESLQGVQYESLPDTRSSAQGSTEALSSPASTQKLVEGAKKFLDSLHPAPFSASF